MFCESAASRVASGDVGGAMAVSRQLGPSAAAGIAGVVLVLSVAPVQAQVVDDRPRRLEVVDLRRGAQRDEHVARWNGIEVRLVGRYPEPPEDDDAEENISVQCDLFVRTGQAGRLISWEDEYACGVPAVYTFDGALIIRRSIPTAEGSEDAGGWLYYRIRRRGAEIEMEGPATFEREPCLYRDFIDDNLDDGEDVDVAAVHRCDERIRELPPWARNREPAASTDAASAENAAAAAASAESRRDGLADGRDR